MKSLEILCALREAVSLSKGYSSDDLLDEAIAELEELQSRSCEVCAHRSELHESLTNGVTNGFCVENGFFTRRGFCCNRHEPKEAMR